MDNSNYGYRYQLITGISLFKNEKENDSKGYVERSIYHFMKQVNEKKNENKFKKEKEFKI